MIHVPPELATLQARGPVWRRTLEALSPVPADALLWRASMAAPLQRARLEDALECASMALLSALASPLAWRARLERRVVDTLQAREAIGSRLLSAPLASLLRALAWSGPEGARLAGLWLEKDRLAPGSGWLCSSEGVAETSLALKYIAYALWKDRIIGRALAVPLSSLEGLAGGAGQERRLALASSDAIQGIIQGAAYKALPHSLLAARFAYWFAGRVQDRHNQGASVIIQHGWYGIASSLTGRSLEFGTLEAPSGALQEAAANCKDIVNALVSTNIPGGCLSIKSWRPGRGGSLRLASRLELEAGDCWRSDNLKERPRKDRALAPLLLPPLEIGRRNEKGALAWMFYLLCCEMRRQGPSLTGGQGALIPLEMASGWLELAGGPEGRSARRKLAREGLEYWSDPVLEGAPLERIGPDRWHISKAYPEIRAFLEERGSGWRS